MRWRRCWDGTVAGVPTETRKEPAPSRLRLPLTLSTVNVNGNYIYAGHCSISYGEIKKKSKNNTKAKIAVGGAACHSGKPTGNIFANPSRLRKPRDNATIGIPIQFRFRDLRACAGILENENSNLVSSL